MKNVQASAKEIFLGALDSPSAEELARYLDEACGGDAPLRARVEELLRARRQAGSFLGGASTAATNAEQSLVEGPGTVIGPYKLLQQIGEGGMGVVFMAEQTEPIERTVALKIIKPGMDTRQVIARFEAERQALALMDHPNIARVLDAGTTGGGSRDEGLGTRAGNEDPLALDSRPSTLDHPGRPYFVMDLVKGVPITDYCDQQHLPIRARLELMAHVCHAVQHAHQKGIIHRDIKPTNVLVAEYDGKPVPKIIDFGVAKATARRLTEKTMFTELGQLIGTFEYMSPEQARFNQLDVDTRSDVYSLGVLLYELLAGSAPLEKERLRTAAFDEILRIIREEEPPKPSTKLSSSDMLPSIAANRHTEPARLSKEVHGDLDWIVMKALEKDRNRRYETASGFAADIDRHLNDKPVEAGPPSAVYRFRKFAKRNRTSLAGGALLTLAVLVALGAVASGMWERTARQARVTGQLEIILDEVERLQQAEKWHEALVAARRAEPALAAGEAAPDVQERARHALGDLELVRRLEETRAGSGTTWGDVPERRAFSARADAEYRAAFLDAGIDIDALPVNEASQHIAARGPIAAAILTALDDWIAIRSIGTDEAATRRLIDVVRVADSDPWRQRLRDSLDDKNWATMDELAKSQELDRQSAATLSFLSAALRANGRFLVEIEVLRRAQKKYPDDFWINHRLGTSLIWRQSEKYFVYEGIGFLRAAVAVRPENAHAVMNLGNGYFFLGKHDEAIEYFRRALALQNPFWQCQHNLGASLARTGRYEDAIASFKEAIRINPNLTAEARSELSMVHSCRTDAQLRDPQQAATLADQAIRLEPNVSNHWTALGVARYRERRWDEARAALDRSLELKKEGTGGSLRWDDSINWFFLAMSFWQEGQRDQARDCFRRATQEMDNGLAWRTDEELVGRVRAEAEELLKITDK